LTDRETLKPRFPRIGKLRKGGEKSAQKPGPDLDHFRFTSNNAAAVEAFNKIYGENPRVIRAVLPYHDYDDCFSSWIECWDRSGLVFRSDGEHWVLWRDGAQYKRGKKAHEDREGQKIVGRLEFVIPELWEAGHRGTVTLETHSNHDLRNIGGVLLAAESGRDSLYGMQFVLRRVEEEISTPGWGEREGQRSKTKKWLVKLDPPHQTLLLEEPQHQRLEEPRHAVDVETGEVIEAEPESQPDDSPPNDFPTSYGEFVNYVTAHTGYKTASDVGAAIKRCGVDGSLVKPDGTCAFNTADVYGAIAAENPK